MNLFDDSGSSSDRRFLRRGLAGVLDDVSSMTDDAVAYYMEPRSWTITDLVPGSQAAYEYYQNNPRASLPGPTPADPPVPLPSGVQPLPPLPPPDEVYQGKTGPALYSYENAYVNEPATASSSGGALAALGVIAVGGFLLLRRSK